MSGETWSLFATFALCWTLIFVGYVILLATAECLSAALKRHLEDRRHRRDLDRRIVAEQAAAVQRIATAFTMAQQLIRDEATASRGDQR